MGGYFLFLLIESILAYCIHLEKKSLCCFFSEWMTMNDNYHIQKKQFHSHKNARCFHSITCIYPSIWIKSMFSLLGVEHYKMYFWSNMPSPFLEDSIDKEAVLLQSVISAPCQHHLSPSNKDKLFKFYLVLFVSTNTKAKVRFLYCSVN